MLKQSLIVFISVVLIVACTGKDNRHLPMPPEFELHWISLSGHMPQYIVEQSIYKDKEKIRIETWSFATSKPWQPGMKITLRRKSIDLQKFKNFWQTFNELDINNVRSSFGKPTAYTTAHGPGEVYVSWNSNNGQRFSKQISMEISPEGTEEEQKWFEGEFKAIYELSLVMNSLMPSNEGKEENISIRYAQEKLNEIIKRVDNSLISNACKRAKSILRNIPNSRTDRY